MKVKTAINVAYLDGMRVMKPIKSLLIVKRDSAVTNGLFTSEIIEVKRINSKTGEQKVIYPKMTVLNAADINAGGVGFYRQNATKSTALLPVASDGLDLDNDSYLEVEITSAQANATVSFDVYGIEDIEITKKNYEFIKMAIPAGETLKKVTAGANDVLAVPAANIVRVTLKGKNGQVAEFLKDELAALCDIQNDIVKVATTVAYGSDIHFVISLDNVQDLEIETDGTLMTFYLIDLK